MERIDNLRWRKSSFSGNGGASCVEVADHNGTILVRDTKDHGRGAIHRYTAHEWRTFLTKVRDGEFGK
jgi:hypothetical protein